MKALITSALLLLSATSLAQSYENRELKCEVSPFYGSSTGIERVEVDIAQDLMTIRYSYKQNSPLIEDQFSNNANIGKFSFTEDKLTFFYDGEHVAHLASFDYGLSYQGKAVISQDFTVFLNCK